MENTTKNPTTGENVAENPAENFSQNTPHNIPAAEPNRKMGKEICSFEAPEFVGHERSQNWLLGLGVCLLFGIVMGIAQQSLSMILVCAAIGAYYLTEYKKKPRMRTVVLTDAGVLWGDRFVLYQNIETFWIVWEENSVEMLHIILKNGVLKEWTIPLFGQNPAFIREVMGYFVKETEGKKERMSDMFARVLKL